MEKNILIIYKFHVWYNTYINEGKKSIQSAVAFIFLKNVPNSSGSISKPNLTHQGTRVLPHLGTSIWGQELSHPGPVLSHLDHYFYLKSCCLNFFHGTSPACDKSMKDQKSCATLYQWAQLFIPWKNEISVHPLFKLLVYYNCCSYTLCKAHPKLQLAGLS